MRKLPLLAPAALALCAFQATPMPPGYAGPPAVISDSAHHAQGEAVNFFYVDKIDGEEVPNSLVATTRENHGRGFAMQPVVMSRHVPAASATFTIAGRTHYATPFQEIMNAVYKVSGDVTFTPVSGRAYEVKGTLGEDY